MLGSGEGGAAGFAEPLWHHCGASNCSVYQKGSWQKQKQGEEDWERIKENPGITQCMQYSKARQGRMSLMSGWMGEKEIRWFYPVDLPFQNSAEIVPHK